MSDLTRRLIEHWRAQGIPSNPGISEDVLGAFEERTGLLIPADLCGYFAVADGMGESPGDCYIDRALFRFWQFAEFESAGSCYRPHQILKDQDAFFLFADHAISLPNFAIRLSSDPNGANTVLAIYSYNREYEARLVARSFTEFVEVYLAPGNKWWDLLSGQPVATLKLPADPSHPLFDADLDT